MRLGRLLYLLALCAGCARPSLEDGVEGSDAGEVVVEAEGGRDAGTPPIVEERDSEVAAPEDAGFTPPEPDSGCPDGDRDGKCDGADNCPEDANPDQADEDADGTGDACELVEVNCQGDQLETGAIANVATLARMTINGETDKVVNVKPGEKVSVSFNLTFSDCDGFALQSLVFGVESTVECQQPAGCTGVSIPIPYAFEFDAPEVPGLHYLLAGLRDVQSAIPTRTCSTNTAPTDAGVTTAKRVAALCVNR